MRRSAAAALVAATLVLAACSPAPSPSPTTRPIVATPSPRASAGASAVTPTASVPTSSVPASSGPFDPTGVTVSVEVAVAGLSAPVDVTNAGDGSGRLFVVEQAGRIRVIRDGSALAVPFLDIVDRVASGGERGLLGLAFHPDFPTDPRFFVDYTDRDGNTVVSSFRVDPADPDRADPASETVLLHVNQPFANHNGGAVEFGPDGMRCTSRSAMAARRAIHRATASGSTPCWPRSCGSVSTRTGPGGRTRSRPTTRS